MLQVIQQDSSQEGQKANSGKWLNVIECGASGSDYETTAVTTAGSKLITVADAGDFRTGQDVVISKCSYYQDKRHIWGPRPKITWANELGEKAELRGYDGSQGDWLILILDVPPGVPSAFRWSEDFGRTWQPIVPMTGDWQSLRNGMEVRFNKHDWENGYTVVFSLRGHLATTIEKIEGNLITLRDAPMRAASDAVLRHRDDDALQAVIDRAIGEKKNVYFPAGRYRLFHGLSVRDAGGITIEGANGTETVLDISEGEGACLKLSQGTEVNLRNFKMVGHSGYDKRYECGSIDMLGACYFWGFAANVCCAVDISGTERVLIENCHGTRMSMECFYARGPTRMGVQSEPEHYTKAITYLRCSVVDNARNAFNNNDLAENTSVLYCRIVDVGGCSWEGASRFVKFIGNYVRNAGTVAMGNIGSRAAHLEELQSGQHIVADNVFEGRVCYGGCAIRAAAGAVQIVIRNNLFINFNSSAVEILGAGSERHLPASNATVAGNIFDMTNIGEKSEVRTAIHVAAADMIVSDNQIYVRGEPNRDVTAIRITEPALNANLHDNLIRNCREGIVTASPRSRVGRVIDPKTFTPAGGDAYEGGNIPYERRQSHRYRGWKMVPLHDGRPVCALVIEVFDPETLQFKLREPHGMTVNQAFEVVAPAANWNIHDNTIDGCMEPVRLTGYGSPTSLFRNNLISRGPATPAKEAVVVSGAFNLTGNTMSGFDEPDAAALVLSPNRFNQAPRNIYRENIFERCSCAVKQTRADLWQATQPVANLFIDCKTEVRQAE